MKKEEIIETIIEFLDDPYRDRPESFDDIMEITLDDAERYRKDYLGDAMDSDDKKAVRAFKEATPGVFLEAYSKYCVQLRHELVHYNLEEYVVEHELVAMYDEYCEEFLEDPVRILPTCMLKVNGVTAQFPFKTKNPLTVADLIKIGTNSAKCDFSKEYCYFDEDKMCIHTTNTPFHDDLIDTCAFVEFILGSADALGELLEAVMTDEEVEKVFGCTTQEVIAGAATHYFVTILHNECEGDRMPWDETQEFRSEHDALAAIMNGLNDHTVVTECYTREVEVW